MHPATISASGLTAALVLTSSLPASASEPETEAEATANENLHAEGEPDAADELHVEDEQGHREDDEHPPAHRFLIGGKGAYLLSLPNGEIHHLGGGGLFFELVLVPHWLEMELAVKGLTSGHGAVLPIEVLLKVAFHVTEVVHPFVGLGPAVVPSFQDENEVFFGGTAEVGSHFWVSRSWAIVAALGYGLIHEHGLVNEAGVNVGVAYGW